MRYTYNKARRSHHPDICFDLAGVDAPAPGTAYVATGEIWIEILGGTDRKEGWIARSR